LQRHVLWEETAGFEVSAAPSPRTATTGDLAELRATPRGLRRMAQVPRDVFAFLAGLSRHNNREWFNANKDRYLAEVRDPMLALIAAVAPGLARISRHIVVDPRPSGGSLMRIYRDTRFSRDKTPYKTNVGIHFGVKAPRDFDAPGYYLHLAPGEVFMGAGLWHPGADALRAIREAIVKDPRAWKHASRSGLSHDEASLKRPPRGFDRDHPLIEDLKRLSFTTGAEFTERQACTPDFPTRFVAACAGATPLMRFLAKALGLAF
jgi:uncharacterized protein (TIGR02453 family)